MNREKNGSRTVLVLGTTGMLGSRVFRVLSEDPRYEVYGTCRSLPGGYLGGHREKLFTGVDVLDEDRLLSVFETVRPRAVINCVGVIKQIRAASDPLATLPLNALFPHRLARLCGVAGSRLVHISTDCVFSGEKGNYTEEDIADARDLYGLSKFLGEVSGREDAVTLRTSIIGHELGSRHGLVEWFLSQKERVKGYRKAVFSGFPTVILARILADVVLPDETLHGLYHVSSEPIDKCSLLELVKAVYGVRTEIVPDDEVRIDRSLSSARFRKRTGYSPPSWEEMIQAMHEDYERWKHDV